MRIGCFAVAAFSMIVPAWSAACETAQLTPAKSSRPTGVKGLFPAPGATGVCPDTPLRITFLAPPTLGAHGKIQILDATNNRAVETIDTGSPTATKTIGGLAGYKYYPVIVSGTEAAIYPRNGVLTHGKTYIVTVDPGVFGDTGTGVVPASGWRFTTKPAAPAVGTRKLIVAADGGGDFCTVQGALDFIPDGNTVPTTIFLRKGSYVEIVFFTAKHAITLLGEDRKQSVITYANNDRFNPSDGNPYAGTVPDPTSAVVSRGDSIYRRSVLLAHRANDLVIANLTIRNTTPTGGSQAETIILNGTTTARAILKDLDLVSTQDTLQINGQAYARDCTIVGDVDFMWGRGPCVFENCICRALRSNGYYTQIRNPGTNHGFVYLRCTFDGNPGATGNYLSRIKTARFPDSEVVLIDCVLGNSVDPRAWQLQDGSGGQGQGGQGGGNTNAAAKVNVHFWELASHDASGKPVDVRQRLAFSRQLKQPDDGPVIASYGNATFVLGNGWNPKGAPIFAAPADKALRRP